MSFTCTVGKDGRTYYFQNGKRVSMNKVSDVSLACGRSDVRGKTKRSKKAVKRRAKISKKKTKRMPKGSLKTQELYVWVLKDTEIPVNRRLLIPFREVYSLNGDAPNIPESLISEYGRDALVVVGEKLNQAFHVFEEERLGWSAHQWDGFMGAVYPVWLRQMTLLYE
jgi:hypothetical protein